MASAATALGQSSNTEELLEQARRLTRWLNSRPWAGPSNSEDLAAEAMLSALELQHKGMKPRWLTSLAQDAARGRGYRLLAHNTRTRNPSGAAEKTKSPTRREIEQQIDLTLLMLPAPPTSYPDHLQDALELIRRVGAPELQQAVQLVLSGADLGEAAQAVGMPVSSLTRALTAIGHKITGRSRRAGKSQTDPEQMDLFGAPTEGV